MSLGQEIKLGIDGPRAHRVKAVFAIQDSLALGVIREEVLGHKRGGLVRAAIVYRALPGVEAALRDSITGAGLDALAASVAEDFVKRLVALERRVGDDEGVAHIGAVILGDDFAAKARLADAAGACRLAKVDDNVGRGLAGRNGIGDQLKGVDDLGVCGLVALCLEVGYRSLQAYHLSTH